MVMLQNAKVMRTVTIFSDCKVMSEDKLQQHFLAFHLGYKYILLLLLPCKRLDTNTSNKIYWKYLVRRFITN